MTSHLRMLLDSTRPSIEQSRTNGLFSDRGFPALMSLKEPALKMLRERYSESFAITKGAERRVHLFMVKIGLWSLIWTFTPRDLNSGAKTLEIDEVLEFLEISLRRGTSDFTRKLDLSVAKARERIENKSRKYLPTS